MNYHKTVEVDSILENKFSFNSIKKNLHNETQSNPEQNWTPQIAEENIAELD